MKVSTGENVLYFSNIEEQNINTIATICLAYGITVSVAKIKKILSIGGKTQKKISHTVSMYHPCQDLNGIKLSVHFNQTNISEY